MKKFLSHCLAGGAVAAATWLAPSPAIANPAVACGAYRPGLLAFMTGVRPAPCAYQGDYIVNQSPKYDGTAVVAPQPTYLRRAVWSLSVKGERPRSKGKPAPVVAVQQEQPSTPKPLMWYAPLLEDRTVGAQWAEYTEKAMTDDSADKATYEPLLPRFADDPDETSVWPTTAKVMAWERERWWNDWRTTLWGTMLGGAAAVFVAWVIWRRGLLSNLASGLNRREAKPDTAKKVAAMKIVLVVLAIVVFSTAADAARKKHGTTKPVQIVHARAEVRIYGQGRMDIRLYRPRSTLRCSISVAC